MENSNFRFYSLRPQKLKNNPTYQSTSGCAEPKSAPDLPRRPVNLAKQNMKTVHNFSYKKRIVTTRKTMGVQFFIPDFGWKLSWVVNTVKTHLTRDQNVTFDYLFKNSIFDLLKKYILLVEVVWVMPCLTGCHKLSLPIREPITIISDGRTSRYTFGASINGAKPEQENDGLYKNNCSMFILATHKLSTPWQGSRRLGFEKKN